MTCVHPQNTPADHIHQAIGQLFDNGELCDICVVIDQKEIKCHGLVLASVSQFFRNKIMANVKTIHISSKDLSPELFERLLEVLYKNRDLVTQETAEDFHKISCFLEIDFLIKRCLDILMHHSLPQDGVQVLKRAEKCKLPALPHKASRKATENIENIQQKCLVMINTPTLQVENLSETSSQESSAPSSPDTDTDCQFSFVEEHEEIIEENQNSQQQTKINKLQIENFSSASSDTSSQESSAPSSPEPGSSHQPAGPVILITGTVEKLENREKQKDTTRGLDSKEFKRSFQEVKKATYISSRRRVRYEVTATGADTNQPPEERTAFPGFVYVEVICVAMTHENGDTVQIKVKESSPGTQKRT